MGRGASEMIARGWPATDIEQSALRKLDYLRPGHSPIRTLPPAERVSAIRFLRRAFQFAGLPLDKNADSFAAVIRCSDAASVVLNASGALAARSGKLRAEVERFLAQVRVA